MIFVILIVLLLTQFLLHVYLHHWLQMRAAVLAGLKITFYRPYPAVVLDEDGDLAAVPFGGLAFEGEGDRFSVTLALVISTSFAFFAWSLACLLASIHLSPVTLILLAVPTLHVLGCLMPAVVGEECDLLSVAGAYGLSGARILATGVALLVMGADASLGLLALFGG